MHTKKCFILKQQPLDQEVCLEQSPKGVLAEGASCKSLTVCWVNTSQAIKAAYGLTDKTALVEIAQAPFMVRAYLLHL